MEGFYQGFSDELEKIAGAPKYVSPSHIAKVLGRAVKAGEEFIFTTGRGGLPKGRVIAGDPGSAKHMLKNVPVPVKKPPKAKPIPVPTTIPQKIGPAPKTTTAISPAVGKPIKSPKTEVAPGAPPAKPPKGKTAPTPPPPLPTAPQASPAMMRVRPFKSSKAADVVAKLRKGALVGDLNKTEVGNLNWAISHMPEFHRKLYRGKKGEHQMMNVIRSNVGKALEDLLRKQSRSGKIGYGVGGTAAVGAGGVAGYKGYRRSRQQPPA